MKSQVLSLRLKPEQMERLQKLARRADRKPSELAARLIEEALRMAEIIASKSPVTVAIGKKAFYSQIEQPLADHLIKYRTPRREKPCWQTADRLLRLSAKI